MMATALEIADWLVRYRAEDAGAPIDAMSLQKHLFYAQGFHLAIAHEPLFADEMRAWRNGPVVPAVYHRYKECGAAPIEPPSDGTSESLGSSIDEFLCSVIAFLAPYTAIALSDATHCEEPWLEGRRGYRRSEPSDKPIPRESLTEHFAQLIDDGENALSAYALLEGVPEPRWGSLYIAGICARLRTKHPFYRSGVALWREKLWQPPAGPVDLPKELFQPPPKGTLTEGMRFSTRDEYRRLREDKEQHAAE